MKKYSLRSCGPMQRSPSWRGEPATRCIPTTVSSSMLARAGIVTFGTVALLKSLRRNEVISTAQFSTAMASLDQRGALGLPPSTMQSTRPWPAVPNEYRWVTDLMEERLESTTQGPEELRARAAELRTEAERTTVEGFREAAWALAERYDQTAAR